jgi:hypothetical protein
LLCDGDFWVKADTDGDVHGGAVRYICGGKAHPDYSVICAFRRENGEVFKEAFTKVLGDSAGAGAVEEDREYQRGRDQDKSECE